MARNNHSDDIGKPIDPALFLLSQRAYNCLRNLNIETLEEVQRVTDAELLKQPNVGRISLAEIRALAPYTGPNEPIEVRVRKLIAKLKTAEGLLRGLQADLTALLDGP